MVQGVREIGGRGRNLGRWPTGLALGLLLSAIGFGWWRSGNPPPPPPAPVMPTSASASGAAGPAIAVENHETQPRLSAFPQTAVLSGARVKLLSPGEEPWSKLEYRLVEQTIERAAVSSSDFGAPGYDFRVRLGPTERSSPNSWRMKVVVSSTDKRLLDPKDPRLPIPDQPPTECGELEISTSGEVLHLSLSPDCEPKRGFLPLTRLSPFRFSTPLPKEPIGIGAQWEVEEWVTTTDRKIGKAKYTLLEHQGNQLLIAYSVEHPTDSIIPTTDEGASLLSRLLPPPQYDCVFAVKAVARVNLERAIPASQVAHLTRTLRDPTCKLTFYVAPRTTSTWPDWLASDERNDAWLPRVLPKLEDKQRTVQLGALHALWALKDGRALIPLLLTPLPKSRDLSDGLQEALSLYSTWHLEGFDHWDFAALAQYCRFGNMKMAHRLLDEGEKRYPIPRQDSSGVQSGVHAMRGILARHFGDLAEADREFHLVLKNAHTNPDAALAAAWWWATAPSPYRNGRAAKELLQRTDFKEAYGSVQLQPQVWAAAEAALGNWDRALALQQNAPVSCDMSFCMKTWDPTRSERVMKALERRTAAYLARTLLSENWIPEEDPYCAVWGNSPPGPETDVKNESDVTP